MLCMAPRGGLPSLRLGQAHRQLRISCSFLSRRHLIVPHHGCPNVTLLVTILSSRRVAFGVRVEGWEWMPGAGVPPVAASGLDTRTPTAISGRLRLRGLSRGFILLRNGSPRNMTDALRASLQRFQGLLTEAFCCTLKRICTLGCRRREARLVQVCYAGMSVKTR